MKILVWLDDLRDPNIFGYKYFPQYFDLNHFFENEVIWLKSYEEFVNWIEEMGVPDHVGFDHDLGGENQVMMPPNSFVSTVNFTEHLYLNLTFKVVIL